MLSVLIPTILGREKQFNSLVRSISGKAHVITCCDNKEMSIGAKRQLLLEQCKTEYFVMVDDDDKLCDDYFDIILPLLHQRPDCISYLELVNGTQTACHSIRFNGWGEGNGYDYYRTPFYKDVLKTDIALKVGFSDMRYGEDKDFSDRLKKSGLIKTELFVDKHMYLYKMPEPMSKAEHNKRYGIK